MQQKNKILSVEQTLENTYLFTIKIYDIQLNENKQVPTAEDFKNSKVLIESQIELLAEDVVSLKVFSYVRKFFYFFKL